MFYFSEVCALIAKQTSNLYLLSSFKIEEIHLVDGVADTETITWLDSYSFIILHNCILV